ncbi:MAG TPA: hypothetical protein VKH81_15885 [Candidatus Angelobacter sp.]|nr:hypothetical protein [Candidatus Angelobacter sp.]
MADQKDEQKLDDLLDSALSEYSAVEPRPGLETRILARIREAAEQPHSRWWSARWLVAGAAVAAIAVVVLSVLFLWPAQKPVQVQVKPEVPSSNQVQTGSTPKEATVEPDRVQKREAGARKTRHLEAQLRQVLAQRDRPAVFPSPAGLSEQEKLMLAYVAQTPTEELLAQVRIRESEKEEFWKDPQPAASRSQR